MCYTFCFFIYYNEVPAVSYFLGLVEGPSVSDVIEWLGVCMDRFLMGADDDQHIAVVILEVVIKSFSIVEVTKE